MTRTGMWVLFCNFNPNLKDEKHFKARCNHWEKTGWMVYGISLLFLIAEHESIIIISSIKKNVGSLTWGKQCLSMYNLSFQNLSA